MMGNAAAVSMSRQEMLKLRSRIKAWYVELKEMSKDMMRAELEEYQLED